MTRNRTAATLAAVTLVAGLLLPIHQASAGGCHPAPGDITTGRGGDGGAVATVEDCAFQPAVVFIEPGDSVTWRSRDPVPHTVTGVFQSWGSSDTFSQGQGASFTFSDEGVYPYYCELHPGMVGTVIVGTPDAGAAPVVKGITGGVEPAADLAEPGPEASAPRSRSGAPVWIGAAALALVAAAAVSLIVRRRPRITSQA